jgi:Rrf2 family protein
MRITAKVDYAVRAVIELAGAPPAPDRPDGRARPLKGAHISEAQRIPVKFLETILAELRHDGIVASRRGADGGYWLAKPAESISVADIIRAVEGPLADVRGVRPDALDYGDGLAGLQRMWVAVRANLRGVLEQVTVADLRDDKLPAEIDRIADDPDAWLTR